MAHGVPDLRTLPLDRFSNFVYWMATRDASSTEVEKFRARLWRPPAGEVVTDTRSPWAPQNEQKGFTALKTALGGKAAPVSAS